MNDTNKIEYTEVSMVGPMTRKEVFERIEEAHKQCDCVHLNKANLMHTDLKSMNLSHAKLVWANLEGACLIATNLKRADLRDANLKFADLRGADLRGSDLSWADLRGADLRGADLTLANLKSAVLDDADLTGANLTNAIMHKTRFNNANLVGAELCKAYIPLWGGSLNMHIDEEQARAACYYVLSSINYSKYVSDETKNLLLTPEILDYVNGCRLVGIMPDLPKIKRTPKE